MHSAASTRLRKIESLRSLASASRRCSISRSDPDPQRVGVDRLEDVIDGALAEGLDGSLEVGVGRDDHHGRSRVLARASSGRKSRALPSGNRRSRTMTSISASEESVRASPIEPAVSTA